MIEINETSEPLNKFPNVMVVNIPGFRAISSGWQLFDELYSGEACFYNWAIKRNHLYKEAFLGSVEIFLNNQINVPNAPCNLVFAVHDNVTTSDAAPYKIIDVKGGWYAAVWCQGDDTELGEMTYPTLMEWVENSKFKYDAERPIMVQTVFPDAEIEEALGYYQCQRYIPIKLRAE